MSDENKPPPRGKPLLLDEDAPSRTPGQTAFLSHPEGTPPYYGFPIIEETRTDGWVYGAVTDLETDSPEGCTDGDGFVVAPDGSRAGLAWDVGGGDVTEISPPDSRRWGVYAVSFPSPVRGVSDLVENFRHVLPHLKAIHARVQRAR